MNNTLRVILEWQTEESRDRGRKAAKLIAQARSKAQRLNHAVDNGEMSQTGANIRFLPTAATKVFPAMYQKAMGRIAAEKNPRKKVPYREPDRVDRAITANQQFKNLRDELHAKQKAYRQRPIG